MWRLSGRMDRTSFLIKGGKRKKYRLEYHLLI